MKKLLLIMLLGLQGCVGVNTTTNTTYCPAPKKPVYQQLDNATHIASDKNMLMLMNDLNMMKLYMEQMNNTIECYSAQTIIKK